MRILVIILLVALLQNSFAQDQKLQSTHHQFNKEVIYGEDGRNEVFDISDPELLKIADSTIAIFAKENLMFNSRTQTYDFPLQESIIPLCPKERFSQQTHWADCSGSLIGPDLILTAGHCVTNKKECTDQYYVFNYSLQSKEQKLTGLNANQVYSCKELIVSKLEKNGVDFAIIRLDREVKDHAPLKFSTNPVHYSDDLVLIGHPSGVPTKITLNGKVRDLNNSRYFVAELDAFSGNSGSSVFNAKDYSIVGVLTRGEQDFERRNNCYVSRVCDENGCRGEDVTRLEEILKYIPTK